MEKKDKSKWVLRPSERATLRQKIGGMLYDYIEATSIRQTNGREKSLLQCVREETRMSDRTLQRVFLGKADRIDDYLRIFAGMHDFLSNVQTVRLGWKIMELLLQFFSCHGEEYLEEQVLLRRTKHKINLK